MTTRTPLRPEIVAKQDQVANFLEALAIQPATTTFRAPEVVGLPEIPGQYITEHHANGRSSQRPMTIADINPHLVYAWLGQESLRDDPKYSGYRPVTPENEGGANVPTEAWPHQGIAGRFITRGTDVLCFCRKEFAEASKRFYRKQAETIMNGLAYQTTLREPAGRSSETTIESGAVKVGEDIIEQ